MHIVEWVQGFESLEEVWCDLGARCYSGDGVEKDLEAAAALFRKAADRGRGLDKTMHSVVASPPPPPPPHQDVESPPHPRPIFVSVHPEVKSCSNIGYIACAQ